MKVLYITNVPSPYRVDFFNELCDYCELTVAYEKKSASDRDKAWSNGDRRKFKEIFLKGIPVKADGAICFGIISILKKRWDIIIVGGYSTPTGMLSILCLRCMKKKFLLNADGGFVSSDTKLKFFVKKFCISGANYWLSTGEQTTKYFLHYGANPAQTYEYPFSSIKEADIISKQPYKKEIRENLSMRGENIVISVGQFIERKGFKELFKACSMLRDNIDVYIIGASPTEEYKEIVKTLQLSNVEFVGFKTKQELMEYYKSADIFILPTREDIWGLVINEAMGCGLPVITTDKCIAGMTMIEDGQNGFIVPVQDATAMAEKINFLAKNELLRKKFADCAINTAKKYTIEAMAERHYEIFVQILKGE